MYGYPIEMFVQGTTLAQNSEVSLVQPVLHPEVCTGAGCTRLWGAGIRITNANAQTAQIDSNYLGVGSGLSSVLVVTAQDKSSVTAYYAGTNRVYSTSLAPNTAAGQPTYAIRPSATSGNFAVRAWLPTD